MQVKTMRHKRAVSLSAAWPTQRALECVRQCNWIERRSINAANVTPHSVDSGCDIHNHTMFVVIFMMPCPIALRRAWGRVRPDVKAGSDRTVLRYADDDDGRTIDSASINCKHGQTAYSTTRTIQHLRIVRVCAHFSKATNEGHPSSSAGPHQQQMT